MSDKPVGAYVHLDKEPRAGEALHMLKKVASLVQPIMRARGWRVGQLAEFYPQDASLLGVNQNRGSKICLRLRHAGDHAQFLPMESVTDTMLHELCHNVHGPHNQCFYSLWDQVRDELEGLMIKGYTGESFLSDGHRLGGSKLPGHEVRRLGRAAAARGRLQHAGKGPGCRLGGATPAVGQSIRHVVGAAAERRNRILRGCPAERLNGREIQEIADRATENGFRTQAEEDGANDAAIARAMWESFRDEDGQWFGDNHVPASAAAPMKPGSSSAVSAEAKNGSSASADARPSFGTGAGESRQADAPGWECHVCTLQNSAEHLCCDACSVERPTVRKRKRAGPESGATGLPRTTIDLTESPGRDRGKQFRPSRHGGPRPTWTCKACTTEMEHRWWTCAQCGWIKDSS
ncbi:DNA damage response protein WSS1 [Drechmeria coniospora]|uniref:DNA damage response protein WSS1 n=1 Tax=Drechmeria coniospora TaxID=98403 RepID=A0A151GC41_DRECN|nr:DNA damage response protein WSS1 [Drechmeria coniospora]KYK54621.1 DNA damage response protein WSS1 [Drechmeria coniospora]